MSKPRKNIGRIGRGIFKLKRPVRDIDKLIEKYSHEKVEGES